MLKYILKRILTMIPMLIGISIMCYFIIDLAPGDASDMYFNPEIMAAHPEYMEQVREQLGLDKPVYVRYVRWLNELVHGNFGYSYYSKRPVWTELKARIGITVMIAALSILLEFIIGLSMGILCAKNQSKIVDYFFSTLAVIGHCIPSFWLALVMILVFAIKLKWLPSTGLYTPKLADAAFGVRFMDRFRHLVLPVTVTAISGIGSKARQMRSSYLDVMNQDYIRTARAKGVSERAITWTHTFRNACIPILTMMSGILPALIGGSFILESIFGIPGLGFYGTDAILKHDYPVIMATIMISSLLVMVGTLIVDILYVLVDPRVKL